MGKSWGELYGRVNADSAEDTVIGDLQLQIGGVRGGDKGKFSERKGETVGIKDRQVHACRKQLQYGLISYTRLYLNRWIRQTSDRPDRVDTYTNTFSNETKNNFKILCLYRSKAAIVFVCCALLIISTWQMSSVVWRPFSITRALLYVV